MKRSQELAVAIVGGVIGYFIANGAIPIKIITSGLDTDKGKKNGKIQKKSKTIRKKCIKKFSKK